MITNCFGAHRGSLTGAICGGFLTLGFLLTTAGGASALPVQDPPNQEPAGDGAPGDATPIEVEMQQARERTNKAIGDAMTLLLNSQGCRNTIGGTAPPDGHAPELLLASLYEGRAEGAEGKINDYFTWNRIDDEGRVIIADAPVGAASNGEINIYKAFHEDPAEDYLYQQFGDADRRPLVDAMFDARGGPLTPDEYRAFVILHELAHLTGQLPADHHDDDFAREAYNSAIFWNCLRRLPDDEPRCPSVGVGGPPPPCPRRGGVIIVPADGTGGSTSHPPVPESQDPVIDFGDGLPESEEPAIDFGSDAPVIRAEDGSMIDGGEVGEAYSDDPILTTEDGTVLDDDDFLDPGGYPDYYDDGSYDYDYDYGYGGGGGDVDDGGGAYDDYDDYDAFYAAEAYAY